MSQEKKGDWLSRHSDGIAYALMGLTALVCAMMFNARLSQSGDDSAYICRALDFLQDGRYPNFQGPLYPLFLSIFVWLKGSASVLMLKLTSLVLIVLSQLAFYRALKGRLSARLLLSVMLMMSVNSWFAEFGGQTFSEALFIALEWLAVGAALRFEATEWSERRRFIALAAVASLCVVLCALTRTVGFVLALAVVSWLLLRRRWVHVAGFLVALGAVWCLWLGVRGLVWGDKANVGGQMQTLLQVDPYAPEKGMETASGYATRFVKNSELYLGKHLVKMLGFRDPDSREKSTAMTVVFYALFLWGAYAAFRKNKAVLFMAVCTAFMMGVTFFALQTLWDQYRLIVPFTAMAYIVLLFGLKDILDRLAPSASVKVMAVLVGVVSVAGLARTFQRADLMALRKNVGGDMLYGYTDDWYNYLDMCGKVNEILPDTSYVACRKPSMARIYSGGRKFYGIYTIPSEDPDTLVNDLRKRGVSHVIIGSLRRDPMNPNGGVINTIHRYLSFIMKKYPNCLEKVSVCGTQGREEATLVKVRYDYIDWCRQQAEKTDK